MNGDKSIFHTEPPKPDILDDDLTNQLIKGENDEEIAFWDACAIAAVSAGLCAEDAAKRADRTLSARRCRHYGQKMPIE